MRLALSLIQIPKHEHATALTALRFLHKLARALLLPKGGPEARLRVGFVVLAHDFANVDGGFAGVVEGDRGHEVVADVGADDVVEEMRVDEAEITIDGCGCAASESPGFGVVMWHACIGVLEESDGHNPVVNPQPRHSPKHNNIPATKYLSCHHQRSNHHSHHQITQHNQMQLLFLEEHRIFSEVEMRDLSTARTSISLPRQVEQQVSRPSKNLMFDIMPERSNRGILC